MQIHLYKIFFKTMFDQSYISKFNRRSLILHRITIRRDNQSHFYREPKGKKRSLEHIRGYKDIYKRSIQNDSWWYPLFLYE